jgi:hypothetical protein
LVNVLLKAWTLNADVVNNERKIIKKRLQSLLEDKKADPDNVAKNKDLLATAHGHVRNNPLNATAVFDRDMQQHNMHSSHSEKTTLAFSQRERDHMPAQLRKEVHVGSHVMQTNSPHSTGNMDYSHNELGRSGVEMGGLAHLQDYNHSNKKLNTPYSPERGSPNHQTVHTQGRPQNSRGGYHVGASAAPFGNAMNTADEEYN